MSRAVAAILAVVGLIVLAVGLYPSGLLGRLNGVGGFSDHKSADVVVVLGAILLVVGIYSMIRRPSA